MAMLLYADSKFTSPYVMSVFVVLTEKRLPFEIRIVDLDAGANNDPDYARTSLTQRVPTLVDDGFALSESSAIAEYLDDAFPNPPMFPADHQQRARARQVQAWLRSDFMPIRQERPTTTIFYPAAGLNGRFPRRRRYQRKSSARRLPNYSAMAAQTCLAVGQSPTSI